MTNIHGALERLKLGLPPAGRRPAPILGERTPFEGEMRILRGQLQPLLDERKPTLLALTACNHGEGTTTMIRELSRSLALDGAKVLLASVAVSPRPRSARSRGARRIVSTQIAPTLFFVDIGDLHQNRCSNSAIIDFRDWVESVKEQYDVVLTDVPPILNNMNVGPLLRPQDGVLLLMEAERTRSAVLATTVASIETAGGHILGIVFNRRRRHIPDVFYQWL